MWTPIVGKSFSPKDFTDYCHTLQFGIWRPSFIVLHNTAKPSLADRPHGLSQEHIRNLEAYYRDTQHWSAGPHLFIDDHQIWAFTPLTSKGVHSPSWNSISWGVEMLGDYATESFSSERGQAVHQNAVKALATLHSLLGLAPSTLRLHKEDPKTTHDCPGKNVQKNPLIAEIQAEMEHRYSGEHML